MNHFKGYNFKVPFNRVFLFEPTIGTNAQCRQMTRPNLGMQWPFKTCDRITSIESTSTMYNALGVQLFQMTPTVREWRVSLMWTNYCRPFVHPHKLLFSYVAFWRVTEVVVESSDLVHRLNGLLWGQAGTGQRFEHSCKYETHFQTRLSVLPSASTNEFRYAR